MSDMIDTKIRQMHAALRNIGTTDLSELQVELGANGIHHYAKVDFNKNSDPIALANAASLMIANIASLKDHLKLWCKKNSSQFRGEDLINSNRSVALIHDLWNIDKHAELSNPPRSGIHPKLQGLSTALVISAGMQEGGGAFFTMDPRTGQINSGASGGGSVQLSLSAQITDPTGAVLGDFVQICSEAAEAWLKELSTAGVPLP